MGFKESRQDFRQNDTCESGEVRGDEPAAPKGVQTAPNPATAMRAGLAEQAT